MQDFRKLRVWHLAHEIALKVIEALPPGSTRKVPGLRSQAIRAATSIASNLAEGCARETRVEFLHFVEIALGSYNELEGDLLLALAAGVITNAQYAALRRELDLLRAMLLSLMRTLRRRIEEQAQSRRELAESRSFTGREGS